MFDKLKQIKQLKELQDSLKEEIIEIEKNGVKIVINGKMEVINITLNDKISIQEQERAVKDGVNEAFKKIQVIAAQKMGMF